MDRNSFDTNNEHGSASSDGATPPSFEPTHSRSRRSQDSQGSAHHRSGNSSSRESGTGNSSVPPSFSPRSQRRSAHNGSTHSSSQPAASFPPQRTRNRAQSGTGYGSPAHTSRFPAVGAAAGYPSAHNPSPARVRRRARGGSIIRRILIFILLFALLFGGWLWFWVDGQLNRSIDLTSTSDNSSSNSWLILGSDARDGEIASSDADSVTGFRTDTILVLTKPRSGPSSLISIPRDSYVEVDGEGMKINAVAQYAGYDALISAVEGITGTKIDHIAQIGFDGIASIVDSLGGVELCYDYDVDDVYSSLTWTAGCHTVDGTTALAFSRMRYSDPEGDIGRAKRQRQVISAVMKKAGSFSTLSNPAKAMNVASATFKALTVDKKANTASMISMALAFKDATGSKGVTGSVYYDNLDYEPGGIGSAVHLDAQQNADLFNQLNNGSISAGTTVGGYTGA
ncbi:LCP family protein [Alloscardovia criceti]|uniref:LCP family protein n=1 Tax=Alloscardovia criceti TaxID=356828 RepID=UPI00035C3919|nr:LCP family protein [Alloscardovia criceti]